MEILRLAPPVGQRWLRQALIHFQTMTETVLLTGPTGTMGMALLAELRRRDYPFRLKVLARDTKVNRKKLAPYLESGRVEAVWGDLNSEADLRRAVADTDIVLHVGGLVSPAADRRPRLTWNVNVGAMQRLVKVIGECPSDRVPALVYIGSVSQYGPRAVPTHWGRAGDPMWGASGDVYALSKIEAERIMAESGLPRWVSLRQSGVLAPQLLFKGSDPITFHVPLRGVLEWATDTASARLLANLCTAGDIPDTFWRRFYNIGCGEPFRMTNYLFECRLLRALSCPPPEKVFDPGWFATRNFHGIWYTDSDRLEELFHFRGEDTADGYFRYMASSLPAWFKAAAIVPAPLIKAGMKMVAARKPLGTLCWRHGADPVRTEAFFGSEEQREAIPAWSEFDLSEPVGTPVMLDHGYDETKLPEELGDEDFAAAARFRGGEYLGQTEFPIRDGCDASAEADSPKIYRPARWKCSQGHTFTACPSTVLLGGHWCPECLPSPAWSSDGDVTSPHDEEAYRRMAAGNPFFRQAWLSTHSPEEFK